MQLLNLHGLRVAKRLRTPCVLITLIMAAWAAPYSQRLNAVDVHTLIETRGAREALEQLFGDSKSEEALADGIATGDRNWLDVAVVEPVAATD